MAKFDPFLSLDRARVEGVGDQILPSGNTAPVSSLFVDRFHMRSSAEYVKEIAPPCARLAFTHGEGGGDGGAKEQGHWGSVGSRVCQKDTYPLKLCEIS